MIEGLAYASCLEALYAYGNPVVHTVGEYNAEAVHKRGNKVVVVFNLLLFNRKEKLGSYDVRNLLRGKLLLVADSAYWAVDKVCYLICVNLPLTAYSTDIYLPRTGVFYIKVAAASHNRTDINRVSLQLPFKLLIFQNNQSFRSYFILSA